MILSRDLRGISWAFHQICSDWWSKFLRD